MAQFMTCHQLFMRCACLLTLSIVVVQPVRAQDLLDPTKPPASILRAASGLEVPAGPILQSVLIGPNRKLAIIDGQTVKLNGKFGNQTLVKLNETSVVLKRGKQLQTLNLHPDFSKKPSQASVQTK